MTILNWAINVVLILLRCLRLTPRYLGNTNTMEVHDLCNTLAFCRVEQIKLSIPLRCLKRAHKLGYDNCAYCIGWSKR